MKLRIAVVGSVLAPYDAISNDIVHNVRALREEPDWEVTPIAVTNLRKDIEARQYGRVSDMLLDPDFLKADVIIYHFGIYYPLLDAIIIGNGRAKQAVAFHNITPLEHAPASARPVIEKSFEQLGHLHWADAIWPVSRENAEMLASHDIDASRIAIQPLSIDRPARHNMRKPPSETIEIVFVGRIVPSKGLQDLVEALGRPELHGADVRVRIVGDLDAADPAFRDSLTARVQALGLHDVVEFSGAVPDEERDRILAGGHILVVPSYHEGFCVPVIEALRAGLLPVVYEAHNLRYVADGLCVSTPPGDIAGLAAALASAVADMRSVLANPDRAALHVDRGAMRVADFERAVAKHVEQFEPVVVGASLRNLVKGLTPRA